MGSPATLGALKEFNPEADRISPYLERARLFLRANKVADDDKVPVFLTVIGGQAYAVLRDLVAPALPEDKSYGELVTALKNHYEPKPVVIAERFHRQSQTAEESVGQFLAALRRLATHCKFEAYLDEALRDRLVCGLRSESTQRRLLSEADLTLQKALELAQSREAADKNTKSLKTTDTPLQPLHLISSGKLCHGCGRSNHPPSTCRFLHATCHKCGKAGHIAPVCKTPATIPFKGSTRQKPNRTNRTNWLGAEEPEVEPVETGASGNSPLDDPNLPIYALTANREKPITVELLVNGKPFPMEVDTGAALSLISEEVKQRAFPDEALLPSQILLRTYTGERLEVLGEMRVHIKYGKQSKTLTLVVVEGDGPSLFGRNWLEHLRLDWKKIGAIAVEHTPPSSVEQLCDRYSEVFKEELGTIQGFQAKLKVDERATPDRLEAEGILEKVVHSEWASPVVWVPKSDGKFRLCGDFKVTLNPVLDVDQYPLPKPQDLFATLAGGKKFTWIDMSQAYLQLTLDDHSQKFVVINTHKGLYKFKRREWPVHLPCSKRSWTRNPRCNLLYR